MEISITKNHEYVQEIVDIHMKTFTGFFLTFLGKGFLKTLYKGFMEHPMSDVIVAIEGNKVIGFCAYSEDLSRFYKYLIKRKVIYFAFYALGAFFRKPKILFRLLRAFKYSGESKRYESYIELSSIGVDSIMKNQNIGSKMLKFLQNTYSNKCFEYIKLETDAECNESANFFYQKNGFVLEHCYRTPEGRRMNEYRFYLRGK